MGGQGKERINHVKEGPRKWGRREAQSEGSG